MAPELDLTELAKALKPLAQQSQFLMLDELDEALLWQLAQEYTLVGTEASELTPTEGLARNQQAEPPRRPVGPQGRQGSAPQQPTPGNGAVQHPGAQQQAPATQATSPPDRLNQPSANQTPAQVTPSVAQVLTPAAEVHSTPAEPSVGKQAVTLDPMDAKNLDSLHFRVRGCEACDLSMGRRRVVFGQGNQRPLVMVIGDQPVADEDMRGLAFVGAEQAMLDKVLFCLALTRSSVYVTRAVKCRPDGDRPANPAERQQCQGILNKQIDLVQPKLILTLGEQVFRGLVLDAPAWGSTKARPYGYRGVCVMGLNSLVDVIGNPDQVPALWEDLRRVRQQLGALLAR